MRIRKYFLMALVSASFMGCSQEDEQYKQYGQGDHTGVSVKFNFETMAVNTNQMRGVETSEEFEEGSLYEWQVNDVTVYFFDAKTKSLKTSMNLEGITYKKTDSKYVQYTSNSIDISPGKYDIFAIANTNNKKISVSNEMQLLNNIDSVTYTTGIIPASKNGFVMTNRGSANLDVEIKKFDNIGSEQAIDIKLERIVARLEVATKQKIFELKNQDDIVYANVSLDKCYYINLPKKFYTFRHVSSLTDLTQPTWNINEHFADIPETNGYIIDPYFFKKNINAVGFDNADGYYANFACNLTNENIPWKEITTSYDDNIIYCLENGMLQDAQKNGYSTGVLFKANLTPNDNVYETVNSSLTKVAPADYPSKLYYFNYAFYTSKEALVNAGAPIANEMTDEDVLALGIRIFNADDEGKYSCYYKYFVRHLDNNNPTLMGVMEFCVVRNNLYRMKVADITGLGYCQPINPDTPDEEDVCIKVSLNVKPWIIRDNINIIL